ncbi:type II toxin-antitoxin system death-on-curing family toxin [Flavisolibacter sp. BT320]|nr:type II toxin-antitoxin system death-on-curing family toxin [Flavisolibacter longurius]
MILLPDILLLHERSINDYDGSHGVRDAGLLEAAIARPFQTFGGKDLYPTPIEKAAALGESLIKNHPFVDGNKRTGLLAMASFLINHQYTFQASSKELYSFIVNISTGAITFDEIVAWLKQFTKTVENA